jgi:hypothetical protein
MKILVEREFLKDCLHELKHNEKNGVNNVTLVLERLLKDNPEPVDENSISQQVSDSAYDFINEPSCLVTKAEDGQVTVTDKNIDTRAAWKFVQGNTPYDITDDDRRWADQAIQKHDDSQIPVRSKEANIQAIKEALAKDPGKISISPLPKGPPDPRCDGCEHQHPYAENLSYDVKAGKVYCNRGVTPTYYKEGRTIRYPPNLMICDMYYLNNGKLAKFGTEWNPPCAQYCIPEVEKIMEREVSNHLAIIEILNILDDPNCTRGWNRTTELRNKVKALKAKIIKGGEIE